MLDTFRGIEAMIEQGDVNMEPLDLEGGLSTYAIPSSHQTAVFNEIRYSWGELAQCQNEQIDSLQINKVLAKLYETVEYSMSPKTNLNLAKGLALTTILTLVSIPSTLVTAVLTLVSVAGAIVLANDTTLNEYTCGLSDYKQVKCNDRLEVDSMRTRKGDAAIASTSQGGVKAAVQLGNSVVTSQLFYDNDGLMKKGIDSYNKGL